MSRDRKTPEIAVGALILDRNDNILLITGDKWNGRYVVPGGHVEEGESLLDCVSREVKEEVGLDVTEITFIDVQDHVFSKDVADDKHLIFLDYSCRAISTDLKLDGKEAASCMWISPVDALKRDDVGSSTKQFIRSYLKKRYYDDFTRLVEIKKRLRKDCPWDAKQTYDTMTKSLREESEEVIEAINKKDYDNLKEEIGDVFFSLLFLVEFAEEDKYFSFPDVTKNICEKLIRRHPHVFGDLKGKKLSLKEISNNWDKIKTQEKKGLNL